MTSCKCKFKKGHCEKHQDACRVHCLVCNPLRDHRKRGGQRRKRLEESSSAVMKHRQNRAGKDTPRSMAEVEKREGNVESKSEVSSPHIAWDGTQRTLLQFFQLQHLRKEMLKEDYRNSGGTKSNIGESSWSKYISAIHKVTSSIFETMIPDGAREALNDLGTEICAGRSSSNPIIAAVCEHVIKSKRGSIERRTLNAALTSTLTVREIENLGKRVGVRMPKLGNPAFERAKLDSKTILSSKSLEKTVIRRKRFDDMVVKEALQFFLTEDFVDVIAWGLKKVKLGNDEVVELPSLVRKTTRSTMFKEYRNWFIEKYGKDASHLPRATAFETLGIVTTSHENTASEGRNSFMESLLHQSFSIVDRIIEFYVRSTQQKVLQLHSVLASNFLKHIYIQHVRLEDPDGTVCTHGLDYALKRNVDKTEHKMALECNGCKFVPFFFDELRKEVREAGKTYMSFPDSTNVKGEIGLDHALSAIDHCEKLTDMWQAHCTRVVNQRMGVAKLHEKLEADCLKNKWTKPREIIVTMDFNKKHRPEQGKGSANEHADNQSVLWHGLMATFYVYNSVKKQAESECIFCDQILNGWNPLDGQLVAAFLEVFLLQLKSQEVFSKLESATIQSDKSSCYCSEDLILALPFLGMSTEVTIARFIHTEASESGELLSSHFSMATKEVVCNITENKKGMTPREVFLVLASRAGVQNSFTQLIEVDGAQRAKCINGLDAVQEGLSVVTQQNEIVFTTIPNHEKVEFSNAMPYSWDGVVRMETWEFSLTSAPVVFAIDVNQGNVTVESGNVEDACQQNSSNMGADGETDGEIRLGKSRTNSNLENSTTQSKEAQVAAGSSSKGDGGAATASGSAYFGAKVTHFTVLGMLKHELRHSQQVHEAEEEARLQSSGKRFGTLVDKIGEQETSFGDRSSEVNEHSDCDEDDMEDDQVQVEPIQRRDILAFAVHFVKDLVDDPKSPLQLRNAAEEQHEYALAQAFDPLNHLKRNGFGRRTRSAEKVVLPGAAQYRKAIAQIVQNVVGTDAPCTSWFLDKLKDTDEFRYRLDLPTEKWVSREVKRCLEWKRSAVLDGLPTPNLVELVESDASPLEEVYSSFIEETLNRDLEGSPDPQVFLQEAKSHFSTTDTPLKSEEIQSRVKSAYSALRATRRHRAAGGISNVGQKRKRGKSTANVVGRYRDFIIREVDKNDTMPVQCWKRLCDEFNVSENSKPDDFPEEDKAMTFIRNWRSKHVKKTKVVL